MKGGGKTAKTTRDTEVGNLFDMMRYTLLSQVNKLYIGQREKLDASGFAVSKDPSPKDTPDKPTIKRIDDANYGGQHGAKIILIQKTNPLDQKKERYTYIVQISKEIDNEDSWTTVLTTMNMHKLIVQGLKRGEIVYFRVARFNARGQSHWSDPHDFIAR